MHFPLFARRASSCSTLLSALVLVLSAAGWAQEPPQQPIDPTLSTTSPSASSPAPATERRESSSSPALRLLMGPGDEFDMTVYGVSELTQHLRLNDAGQASLPLIGNTMLAGLTAEQAQTLIEKKYSEGHFLKDPHVTIAVKEYTSQGITVIGEVQHPGTYSALKARRLVDLFMLAGGMTQRAGNSALIVHADAKSERQKVELSADPLKSIEANVLLQPGDTVVVSRAGIVYVMGEVTRPGGFVITTADGKMTIMQALAMASGPTRIASLGHAKMLRRTPAGLESKEVDLGKILQAKAPDLELQAEDVIFVPTSKGKAITNQGAGSLLSTVASLAIYRF